MIPPNVVVKGLSYVLIPLSLSKFHSKNGTHFYLSTVSISNKFITFLIASRVIRTIVRVNKFPKYKAEIENIITKLRENATQ